MTNLDLIIQAIKDKKSISFEYNRNGKTPGGVRKGNLYVLFIQHYKDSKKNPTTKLDIWQTEGVTDSGITKPLPDWRLLFFSDISNIQVHKNEAEFVIVDSYKPDSERYNDVIEKI